MLLPYHKIPDDAKVWIYQADRPIELDELNFINDFIEAFVDQWQSENQDVLGYAAVYYRRFIVLMADANTIDEEAIEEIIDIVKFIEDEIGIDFFQSKAICYKIGLQDIDSFYLEEGTMASQCILQETEQVLTIDKLIPIQK